MKRLLLLSLLLAACSTGSGTDTGSTHPADASQSEINMAEMMDISVEELRKQTPEEHMQMMKDMMKPSADHPSECEGDGCSCHVAQAPDAPKKGGCGCGKAACNKAS
jgi:hypothetical protein